MPRVVVNKVNSMQEQMVSIRREMEILRGEKEILQIKKLKQKKIAFDGLICIMNTAKERISLLEK